MPLGQMSPLALVLGMRVGQETGAQKDRMLAILLAQRIDALIQIGQPLQPEDVAKQIELAVIGLRELTKDYARRTIQGRASRAACGPVSEGNP